MQFNVVLEKAEEGGFNVIVPALDGCFTQGDTVEEALVNCERSNILLSWRLTKAKSNLSKTWISSLWVRFCIMSKTFSGKD